MGWSSIARATSGSALIASGNTRAMASRYPLPGYGIRGADIDRNGVVWAALASGHLGQFDRRKCKGH
jgi:streptogramin lyase